MNLHNICLVIVWLGVHIGSIQGGFLPNWLRYKEKGKVLKEHCGKPRSALSKFYRDILSGHNSVLNKRIVGGQISSRGEWPWLVTLQVNKFGIRWMHLCGGTLIDPQWVATAAHCFEDYWTNLTTTDPSKWLVRVGEHNLIRRDDIHTEVGVEQIFFHPKREHDGMYDFDIALVKLKRAVPLSEYVNVICLPDANDVYPVGTWCSVAGWGYIHENISRISAVVRHVDIPVWPKLGCRAAFARIGVGITPRMICAGLEAGGRDACNYDSGGPLVCKTDNQWTLAGLVSFGEGCAQPGFPGVYSSVPKFMTWMKDTVETNSDQREDEQRERDLPDRFNFNIPTL